MGKNTRLAIYYTYIFTVTILAAVGFGFFGFDFSQAQWPAVFIMAILAIYFQLRSVDFGGRMSYSLGTAIIFPTLCTLGIAPAMLISLLASAADSIARRKSWDRVIFNASQLPLCALFAGIAFKSLGGEIGNVTPQNIWIVMLAALAYTSLNIWMVTVVGWLNSVGTFLGTLRIFSSKSFVNFLIVSYIGIIFTLFTSAWHLAGIVLFGVLIVGLTELLQIGIQMNAERNLRRQMEKELVLDEKTQVYNFRFLNDWLSEYDEEPTAVLFIDIDDFKKFNDAYGHQRGDEALRQVADAIKSSIRSDDKVIRYGGEEFVVILPNMGKSASQLVADRVQYNLGRIPQAKWEYPVTVSIGMATYPGDASDKHQLLRLADLAMYKAKQLGKNQSCFWCPEGIDELKPNTST